jgi:hypothetical protein
MLHESVSSAIENETGNFHDEKDFDEMCTITFQGHLSGEK